MATTTILDKAKLSLGISTSLYDDEISDLILAAESDLALAGVVLPSNITSDLLVVRAIITYCKLHFSFTLPSDVERIQKTYDEQKAQLRSASGYTEW